MATPISSLTPASSMAAADYVPGVQGGVTVRFAASLIRILNFLSGSVAVASRGGVNFIAGSSTTVTVTDDSANNRVDVTIGSSATPNNDPATKVFKSRNFM